MTTATLASDSAVSLSPAQGPARLPRLLAQAVGGVLRQPSRWPFSSGLSRGRQPAPMQPAQPVQQPARPLQPAVAVVAPDTDTAAAHSQSLGSMSQTVSQGVTTRQMVVDILLVAMWGALVPGLMWLGAAAGF